MRADAERPTPGAIGVWTVALAALVAVSPSAGGMTISTAGANARAETGLRAGGSTTPLVGVSRWEPTAESVRQRYVEGELLLRLRTRIPAEAAVVWDAWTRADQLVQWFPHQAEMTVTEGGEYTWRWEGHDGVWQGSFVEVERPEVLAFTWNPPASFFPEGAYETTVRLSFEETDGETTLTLEHSGFRAAGEMEATYARWEDYLYNLRAYLLRRQSSQRPS